MRRVFLVRSCIILFISVLVYGCAYTKIQTDWRDPSFSSTFKKVLIICVVQDPLVRTTLESDLAAQFTNRGIKAVESNTIASLMEVDRERVIRKVREIDADGVLLVRPVGHTETISESNDLSNAVFDAPPSALIAENYRVKVDLFETVRGKVVWEALSDTLIGGAWMDTLNNFAKVMGAKLIERGLI